MLSYMLNKKKKHELTLTTKKCQTTQVVIVSGMNSWIHVIYQINIIHRQF